MIATKSATLLTQATTNQQRKRKALLTSTAMAAAGLLALTTQAHADNWTDHEILSGSTTVDTSVANTTNILQGTHFVKARGNGDINAGWTVNLAQPSTSAKYVLYDVKGDATKLLGTLNANGEIYIFNQQGIIFGADSVVNVGAIVASTGSISDEDILSGGKLVLENVDTGASIVLNGSVTVAEAGLAAFVAPTVVNNGVISAKLGKVALASGNKVTLDLYGDNLVEIAVDDKVASGLIENNGTISAEGGTVYMAAQTAKEAVDTVINMKGVVSASSASVQGGKIVLSGGSSGKVNVTGTLDASGANGGGEIDVRGQDIEVGETAQLMADAGQTGNGGTAIVFADNVAIINGRLSARGGAQSGNGGFVETSGYELGVSATASVDVSSTNGLGGLWLLDSLSIVISDAAGATVTIGGGSGSVYRNVNAGAIETALAGGNVTVQTGAAGTFGSSSTPGSSQNNDGDIRLRAGIDYSGAAARTLSMIAHDDIVFENNADINNFGGGNLSVDLRANDDITINSGSVIDTNGGNVVFTAGGDITLLENIYTNGGGANFTADNDFEMSNVELDTSGGNVTVIADEFILSTGNGQRINAGTGTVTVARESNGSIGLGDASGGLEISQNELNKISAAALVIGRQDITSGDDAIFVEDADLTRFNLVTLNTRTNSSDNNNPSRDQDVVFDGLSQFKALVVNAEDDVVFDDDARVSVTAAATFNAGLAGTVGDFIMDDDSTLDGNGASLTINSKNVTLDNGADIESEGGNVTIATRNVTLDDGADIDALGGNILINNTGVFDSDDSDSMHTRGTGIITLNQSDDGSIQNAIDAVDNAGTGLNTINVGAGTYNENVRIYENNFALLGAKAGVSGNDASRNLSGSGESKIVDGSGSDGAAYGFKVTSNNVRIDGFSVNVDGAGILLDGGVGGKSEFLIENNIIKTINVSDSQDVGVQGKKVSNVTVEDNSLVTIGNDGMDFNGGSNVTIRNNIVHATNGGAYDGIRLTGVNTASITGNTVHDTGDDGIVVENGTGTTTVSSNTVYNVDKGINVNNTAGLNISGNTVYNVDENAIHVVNSAGAQIANNLVGTLGFVTGTGIFVDPSPLTSITGNIVNGGQIGIHVLDSDNVTVGGFGAGQANSVTGSYVGIKIQNSDAATVAKNTVNNSGWDAIQIVDGSDNAQVLNNDINGVTGASGIAVMNNSHGAVLDGNTIDDTARLGIYVWNSNGLNIKNNLINNAGLEGSGWYLSGIHLEGANNTTVDNNEVKNARGDGIHVGGAGNQAAQSTTGNVIKNNSVFLISGDAVDVTDSAGVQITGNALGTDSLGGGLYLVIGANNVSGKGVNLNNSANANVANNVIFQVAGNGIAVAGSNGTTVSGNYVDAVGANAIHVLNSVNARILNNNIGTLAWYFGADSIKGDGIYVENASGTWIKGNTINETYSTAFDVGSGIHVKNSNDVVVGGAGADRNNLSNIDWDGVKITGGNNVTVNNNRIENVTRVGIYGGNTTNATIKNNVLVNANTGLGGYGAISTDGGSGLKITGNDIDGSVGHGIRVNGATGTNLIDGNFVDGVSQDGINTEGVNKLTVSNNKVGQSSTVGATGINVVNGTHSTTISNNLVDRVGWTGIAADTVAGLKVLNNTVGANSASVGQGIYVNNSTNADVIGNNVYNAMQYGLYANLSNGLDVYDNDIGGLGSSMGAGVYIQDSSNVNIGDYDQYFLWWKTADRDNRIGSFQQGVYISGGAHNDVVNNAISNVHYGVTLSATTNADVTDNTLTGNSVTGVSVGAGSDYATINNNSISHFETAISVDSSNFVNVDNNNIFNVDSGIYATNTYGLNIEDNDITGGHCGWGDSTGIHVDNSSNVRIGGLFDGNDVDSFYDGIRVSDSEDVRISFNDVWNMDHDGIQAFGGDDVNISWNHVTDVGNDGIFVGGMSDWNYDGESDELVPNAVISHNVVDWTGGDGIEVNDVTYSRINHNAVGLDGYASEDNYYEYDDGVSIGQNGIVVSTEYWDDPTEIDGNLVANTGWNGIAVYGVEEVTITNNTVWNTHDNGIVVEDAEWVDIGGNYVGVARPLFGPFSIGGGFIGDDGIRVGNYWYGNYGSVWITDNHVGNTGDDGIDVYGVSEARILGNDVNMTGDDGIVASNIGDFFYGPSIFALEGDYEGDESEEGPYYSLIIADNTVTDAGQRNQNDDDCGDCESEEFFQIFEGDHENYGGDGIDVSGTSSALIEGNEVDNSYDDGIVVSGFGDRKMGKRGFSIYQDGPSEYGPSTSVVIRDNDVTNSGSDGIEVSNIDDATVDINRILNSGINGFHAGGLHNGMVVLTGNTFTDNPVGALFESGMIDLTGEANIFNGGEVGLRFDPKNEEVYVGDRWVPYEDYDYEEYSFYESGYWEPIYDNVTADLNLVDNTIGTTIFNGQSQYYVELLDGALFAPGTPTIINGLNATYDGFRPSTVGGILTQDQYNALEAKIYHYNDLASLGLFFFGLVPNEIDQEDIFRNILGFSPRNGSLNLTITGLPVIPGFAGSVGSFLNSIAPAAGGNDPEQLANLEPAAGGDNGQPQGNVPQADDSSCWGDAMEAASGGAIVNMNYDMSPDAALNQAAACQSGI
ncbi:MAG: right-handed parallel beta-helix repeat-containing protein [Alphaproteobacteria bacterium]|nr:right-handed parallel beta-helix repeat-containing protein [Alphaproteobacteria bacterium]